MERPRPFVIAHRGNNVAAPENTLAAFRRAIADGADVLETDLHVTRDGAFVCIHDATLDRTAGRPGVVAELTLEELRAYRVAGGRAGFEGERVPTLDELLALVPPGVALMLELKSDAFLSPAVARRLAERLRHAGVLDRAAVLSFAFERCRAVKREAAELKAGFVTLSKLSYPADADLVGPFWPLLLANPLYVFRAHRRGKLVAPLDPKPDARLWLYRLLGVDAVLTDDPAATLAKLGRKAVDGPPAR